MPRTRVAVARRPNAAGMVAAEIYTSYLNESDGSSSDASSEAREHMPPSGSPSACARQSSFTGSHAIRLSKNCVVSTVVNAGVCLGEGWRRVETGELEGFCFPPGSKHVESFGSGGMSSAFLKSVAHTSPENALENPRRCPGQGESTQINQAHGDIPSHSSGDNVTKTKHVIHKAPSLREPASPTNQPRVECRGENHNRRRTDIRPVSHPTTRESTNNTHEVHM